MINHCTREKIDEQHKCALTETAETRYAFGKAKTLSLSVNELSMKMIQIVAFATAGILLVRGEITIGTGVATFGYVSSFIEPIDSVLYDVSAIQSVKAVKERFLAYVERQTTEEKERPIQLHAAIEMEHLNYCNDDFSLKDIDVRFETGKKYAVIGPSGSGKSTLLKLLMGYLAPQEGKILIDGKPLEELDTSELIAYVDQREHIYRAGAMGNATVFGSYPAEKVKSAQAHFSMKMMETIASRGEDANCQELSGGERQTLAFLRMLAKDSEVILLDEPFAAVDAGTKSRLEEYLLASREMQGKTLVMVTRDTSEQALARYDEVLVMKDGKMKRAGA